MCHRLKLKYSNFKGFLRTIRPISNKNGFKKALKIIFHLHRSSMIKLSFINHVNLLNRNLLIIKLMAKIFVNSLSVL